MIIFTVNGVRNMVMVNKIVNIEENAMDDTCTIYLLDGRFLKVYMDFEKLYEVINKYGNEYLK